MPNKQHRTQHLPRISTTCTSGTPLNWTPLGPEELSGIEGCPVYTDNRLMVFVVLVECHLRTFVPIATAHPYSARKFTCHVMHRARMLSTKMNNDRADGHCYSFAWI